MLKKSNAIDRMLRENPNLADRRFGLPYIGGRLDGEKFNPTVQNIADAIDFYGYEVRDENITTIPDIDLGSGNPTDYEPFPLSIEEMKKALDSVSMYKYPYTEGDDNIRKILLDYIEEEGFFNDHPYAYSDIDDKGLSVHNITFLPSTSIAFNMIINIISKPGDVVLITGPNYGLFTIRAERAGAEVEIINLEK
ncbi:MAG: aminotransferase class I/II-fold pyridoxal phosphate-dependent enzyme [Bacilli bacterium]|nr:aminotransferase class I/II-fold pyridoxal phosphate-dependent enzyme [Bacilli bacterium]